MLKNLKRILFSSIIFLIPINLGKHFITVEAYVRSRLVDYLIPTIWLIDILIFLLLLLWIIDGGLKNIKKKSIFRFFVIFVAVLVPSVLVAERLEPAIYFFLTLILRMFFMFYISEECNPKTNFIKIVRILGLSVFLLSLLGILQWLRQGSVFNNYLYFGEQPYTSATFDVVKVNLFGRLKVPIYGTFRHPNVFAGFLSIALLWIYYQISSKDKSLLLKIAFTFGFLSLILTFSQVALFSFSLSILFLFLVEKFGKKGVLASLGLTAIIFLLSLTVFVADIPATSSLYKDPSFFRRANLLKSAYLMIKENFVFGVGLNNFTVMLPKFLPLTQVLVFNQPVHNIFVLLFAEAGLFTFLMFTVLLIISIRAVLSKSYGVPAILFITILNLIILGSFDHYLLTIHQTQLMLWLTLGLSLAYTEVDEK